MLLGKINYDILLALILKCWGKKHKGENNENSKNWEILVLGK